MLLRRTTAPLGATGGRHSTVYTRVRDWRRTAYPWTAGVILDMGGAKLVGFTFTFAANSTNLQLLYMES